MLTKINNQARIEEQQILKRIIELVDRKQSFVFNAGAGSGKTYALVETIKHICREYEDVLSYNNQKVLCITYTNVAANEIKNRLGNTELALVSTIHDRLWSIIKDYQEELVIIHSEYVHEEVERLSEELKDNKYYTQLETENWRELIRSIISKSFDYYKISDFPAKEFRIRLKEMFPICNDINISNVADFKALCNKIIKIDKYKKCIVGIKAEESCFRNVKYNSRSNKDALYNMSISHDTLLIYSLRMVEKYDLLRRIIADQYPFILIDEYQDTNEMVSKIIRSISDYSHEIGHHVTVGYYGDSVQHIYDAGIGNGITQYTEGFKLINKEYNRRSCQEIIELANKVRGEDLKQKSIYDDAIGGSVEFYYSDDNSSELIRNFVTKMISELNEGYYVTNEEACMKDNRVHCFFLTNKTVADFVGIVDIYEWFQKSNQYMYARRDDLNSQLLSNDVNKLGVIQRIIFNVLDFKNAICTDESTFSDIFRNEKFLQRFTVNDIKNLARCLKNVQGNNLEELIKSIDALRKNIIAFRLFGDGELVEEVFADIFGMEQFSLYEFKKLVYRLSFDKEDISDDVLELRENIVDELLNINIDIFQKWYIYVKGDKNKCIAYHTFHGTKGAEYENVIMVFGDEFGRSKNFFKEFFEKYGQNNCEESEAFIAARNLLYVAVTRAIKNLRILYTGQYKEEAELIFGKATELA